MMGFLKFCFQTRAWSDMCIAQLFKLKCKNRMQLNTITCVRASRTFCQRSLVQFSRNYVVQQGFVASPWKKSPQAPAVATKTYLAQHFLFCFFKPCLSTQKGRRASTARSQAVERTDKLPECVLSRRSKHASRPTCRVPLSGLDMSWNWSHALDMLASIALAVTPPSCQW